MAKRDKDDDRPDEDAAKGGDASSADAGKGSGEGGGTAPTLLPPVPTRCPMIPTKCPEIPRLCAQDDAALAGGTAAFPTLPITSCPRTICPDPTQCPPVATLRPDHPTICPPTPTSSPNSPTTCVPTTCIYCAAKGEASAEGGVPIPTVCAHCGGGSGGGSFPTLPLTQCPPTVCPHPTQCPPIPIICGGAHAQGAQVQDFAAAAPLPVSLATICPTQQPVHTHCPQ